MLRGKNGLKESELEDTEVADEPTPEKEEVPDVEAEESYPKLEKAPTEFTASITLDSDLIESKSVQEITTVLDNQLRAIREAAIRKIHRIKS